MIRCGLWRKLVYGVLGQGLQYGVLGGELCRGARRRFKCGGSDTGLDVDSDIGLNVILDKGDLDMGFSVGLDKGLDVASLHMGSFFDSLHQIFGG